MRSGKSGEDLLNAQGAGDQGMMFGYACDETEALMPLPIWLAHRMAERLAEVRRADVIPYLRPDGKTQVTFDYEGSTPVRLRTVLISTQHAPGIDRDSMIRPDLIEHVIRPGRPRAVPRRRLQRARQPDGPVRPRRPARRHRAHRPQDHRRHLRRHGPPRRRRLQRQGPVEGRPLGRLRGPLGGQARRGLRRGQPLRGAGGLRHRCGPAGVDPGRDLRHRRRSSPTRIEQAVRDVFDLRPAAIINELDLRQPIYRRTAAYGHFGRDEPGFTWEQLGNLESFKAAVGA